MMEVCGFAGLVPFGLFVWFCGLRNLGVFRAFGVGVLVAGVG